MKEESNFSPDMKSMIEISKSVITKLGIKNFKLQPGLEKCRILFLITNMGQSIDESWSTFPVLIDVNKDYVKIYIVFTFRGKAYSFSDKELRSILLNYITMVNSNLRIGMLKFSDSKQYTRFENSFCYSRLDKKH